MPVSTNRAIQINFTPSAKQAEAYARLTDKTTRFVGYGGAARGGKTYLMAYWLTIMSIAYPGTAWGLCRKNLSTLKRTTLVTLFKVFNECSIFPERDFKYNQQRNEINFTNGSVIFLVDLDFEPSDPLFTRIGGLELTGAAIDESVELHADAITILNTRIGWRKNDEYGITPKILETFNPAKNHVFTRYYEPWKKGTLPDTYSFTLALPKDNPSPEVPAFIEGVLAEGNIITIQRLIHGNFEYDDDPRSLIPHDKISDLWYNTHVPGGTKYITSDLARLGGDRIVKIEWDGWRGKITAWKKQTLDITTNRLEESRCRLQIGVSSVLVDEGGLGGGIVDFKKYKGFISNATPFPSPSGPTDPNTGKRMPEQYDNLKSQCGYRFAERACNNGVYLECDDPAIMELVNQELAWLKQDKVDNDGKKALMKKDELKKYLQRSPDFLDALIMREWFELKPKFVITADEI